MEIERVGRVEIDTGRQIHTGNSNVEEVGQKQEGRCGDKRQMG